MKYILGSFWCILIYGICPSSSYSQHTHQYQVEVGSLQSTAQTPFWLRANQYGTVPLTDAPLRFNAGLQADYRPADTSGHRPKVDWGYGANIVFNGGTTNQFLITEGYLKARIGTFELYAGRRKEIIGLVDTLLTTGAYVWSGNALPIPKVQVGFPTFTNIPFTKGALAFLGTFSHGWFENSDRQIKGSYLHQTHLYGRLGKTSWRFRLYAGFNHQVIWAGQAALGVLPEYVAVDGNLPSNIRYYPAVVLGTRGADYINDKSITAFEDNRIGNHLGSLDLAADVNISHWNLFFYRQFVYDDGSLFYGTNLDDGLNGLRLKNLRKPSGVGFFLRQITLEYLFTGSQGGDVFVIDDPLLRGRDNYFNHSQFIDGWTYFGRTIGTPFLTPQQEAIPSLPSRIGIVNNRVSVFHFGLSALLFNKVDVSTKLSFSQNAGTYDVPYLNLPQQFSGLFTVSVPVNILGGISLNGSFAVDSGELLPESKGGFVSLRKTGLFTRRPVNAVSPRRISSQ